MAAATDFHLDDPRELTHIEYVYSPQEQKYNKHKTK